MICGPLDIPDEVAAALGAGELVIFAGAGVSCGGRSDLPSFDGLTEQIRERLAQPLSEPPLDLDVQLGDWKGLGGDVHAIAREIIVTSPGHNPIHRHLLELFPKQELIRIVTTNFDRHFSSAAAELGIEIPTYRAPALPLGHDFHGLVYLHGYVDDRPDRLVLTDADFGRAYLSEGWARTFLQGLYANFNVLFVGYSHGDVLLTYLAKGLSQHGPAKRHAFQLRGGEKKWNRIHITPIPYGHPDTPRDHSELGQGVQRWLELLRLKPSDEMARVRSIIEHTESPAVAVGGESTLEPTSEAASISGFRLSLDDADFLRRILGDSRKVVWFLDSAKDLRWVAWALEAKLLDSFAEPQVSALPPIPSSVKIVWWALSRLLADPVPAALELFAKLGGRLGPDVWQECIGRLVSINEDDPLWGSPHLDHWLVSLRHGCSKLRNHDVIFLGRLVVRLAGRGLNDHAIGLFARLLQVHVEWKQPIRYLSQDSWSARAALIGDLHSLKEVWTAFAAMLGKPECRVRLFRILSECVEELYAAFGLQDHLWDPLAGLRIVVDEPQNEYDPGTAEAFVGDMLCQLIKRQSAEPEGLAEHQILIWLRSERLLWQRLGYLALRVDRRIATSRKVAIILELGLIYPLSRQLQHDPHALVTALYGTLSVSDRTALLEVVGTVPVLEHIASMSAEKARERATRIRDGLLTRLALAHVGDPELATIFQRLGLTIPTPQAEPKDRWPAGAVREINQSPIPASEILKRHPGDQLDEIINFKSEQRWDASSRDGYFAATITVAKENIEWAKDLVTALAQRTDGAELWARLGWECPWLSEDANFRRWFLLELFPTLNSELWNFESYRSWSSRLLGLADRQLDPPLGADEWAALTAWSIALWDECGPNSDEVLEKKAAMTAHMRAINHPMGQVIEFWLSSVGQLRRNDATLPYDWPNEFKPLVEDLLSRDDDYRLMALSIFGQQLRFVRYAFPDWTRQEIYPRFDFGSDAEQARCLWSTWLSYGNLSLELAQELPPLFTTNHAHMLGAEDGASKRFLSYLAVIAASIAAPPDTLTWLRTILRNAAPEQRAWWTTEVARNLRGANEVTQQRVWNSWARDCLLGFRQGTFGNPSRPEAKHEFLEFLHWPIAFNTLGGEVLDSLMEAPRHRIERLDVIYEIKQAGLAATAPDLIARYLRWTLVDVGADRWGFFGLDDVLTALPITPENRADVGQISEQLLVMGMTEERQLLAAKIGAFDACQSP
jgi:hypothetical protein